MTDEYHTTPSKHLVNFTNINQILKSEIFLHTDGQFQVVYVILEFKPLSKCFQSSKYVIKAKDAQLALIEVDVPRFLLAEPPSIGT